MPVQIDSDSNFKHDPVLSEKLIGKESSTEVVTVGIKDSTPEFLKDYKYPGKE